MNPYLFRGLEFGPVAIRRLVEAVPSSQYDLRTEPERFSVREAVAHLADWEPILLGRMRLGVEAPGSPVQAVDEAARAVAYAGIDPLEQTELFAERRRDTIAFLQALSPKDWQKTVVHSEWEEMTIYDQASMLLGHDLYHIEHLTQYLETR